MLEVLKCLFTGLAVFSAFGLLLWGYSYIDFYIAKEIPYLFPGLFALGGSIWLGTIIRWDDD